MTIGAWRLVVEDHRIEPGGCRISSPNCEIDATLATRWKRVIAGLGRDASWIDTEAQAWSGSLGMNQWEQYFDTCRSFVAASNPIAMHGRA